MTITTAMPITDEDTDDWYDYVRQAIVDDPTLSGITLETTNSGVDEWMQVDDRWQDVLAFNDEPWETWLAEQE